MGRPSNREERRAQIIQAFAIVLADHGYAGATVAAVASEAGLAPGLIHHHFKNKDELLTELMTEMLRRFRKRRSKSPASIEEYVNAALSLEGGADIVAARCWVGLFAEAVRNPDLFARMRRMIDSEIGTIVDLSGNKLSGKDAGAILSFIVGSLVVGAFAPRKTAGFAAPSLHKLVEALEKQ